MNLSDLYTATLLRWHQTVDPQGKNTQTYAYSYTRYEVRRVADVRNLRYTLGYRVTCALRVIVPPQSPIALTPSGQTSYGPYPASLQCWMNPDPPQENGVTYRLLDYSPRTVNTAVVTSANQSDGTTNTSMRQHSVGSSVSQTNSYSASASLGFLGEDLTGSATVDAGHSTTRESSSFNTTGSSSGSSIQQGAADSMSIKDWGAYTMLDARQGTVWVWGQEFPWDVLQYGTNLDGMFIPAGPRGFNAVQLPDFVMDRLFDNPTSPTMAFPPSQLARFGLDFTMKAAWHLDVPANVDPAQFGFWHGFSLPLAYHGVSRSGAVVALSNAATNSDRWTSQRLDLTLLALDPIANGGPGNGAVIGFIPSKFIAAPQAPVAPTAKQPPPFKILSDANNLQVTGWGFGGVMTASFPTNAPTSLTISFKIVDDLTQYALFMKHWVTGGARCTLRFTINGGSTLTRRVEYPEGQGGDDNLTTIVLRNRDYTSAEYHDYLQKGLNTIQVTITRDSSSAASGSYVLRAVAIGEV